MPRYYFDIDDGDVATGDDEGQCYADAETARREAIRTLTEIVTDRLPNGDNREFTIKVWDEFGAPIFEALMSFKSGWIGTRASQVRTAT